MEKQLTAKQFSQLKRNAEGEIIDIIRNFNKTCVDSDFSIEDLRLTIKDNVDHIPFINVEFILS